jgi:hypothetical protein
MSRYHFDVRDGEDLDLDKEGLEFSTLEAAQREATRSLADIACEAVKQNDGLEHRIAIEVRDDTGPVLRVRFSFEIDRIKKH